MIQTIARNATTAWRDFCALGEIELGGRDSELEKSVRIRLSSRAPDLPAALARASVDDLVRALFQAAAPYAAMFRDIIAFFKRAAAREGRAHWTVKLENQIVGLEDFETFLKHWHEADIVIDVPAINFKGAWSIFNAARPLTLFDEPHAYRNGRPGTGDSAINDWLMLYGQGNFPPLPAILHPHNMPAPLRDAAAICRVATEIIRGMWETREALMQAYSNGGVGGTRLPQDLEDAFQIGTIAQNETDFWLGSAVTILGRAITSHRHEAAALGTQLTLAYAKLPHRSFAFTTQIALLERLLTLPVWHKRHELYAVWIATEIVNALPEHEIALHHEDGKIEFAFRETKVATIASAAPPITLYAERRVPLVNPVGESRKNNVQPDYSLWAGPHGTDRCRLVVEVKHYLTPARAKFEAALIDYAAAHPQAQIVLVNHGAVSKTVARNLPTRCEQIGDLRSDTAATRARLRDAVRDAVGQPVAGSGSKNRTSARLVAIDVSGSMRSMLKGRMIAGLADWLTEEGLLDPDRLNAQEVVLIDNTIRARCGLGDLFGTLERLAMDRSTGLARVAADLLKETDALVIVTDEDGVRDLGSLAVAPAKPIAADGLWQVDLRAQATEG